MKNELILVLREYTHSSWYVTLNHTDHCLNTKSPQWLPRWRVLLSHNTSTCYMTHSALSPNIRSHDWWRRTRLSSEPHPGREKQDGWHIRKVCCERISRRALAFKATAACSSVQAALRPEPGELREEIRQNIRWRWINAHFTCPDTDSWWAEGPWSCSGINVVETGGNHWGGSNFYNTWLSKYYM